VPKAVDQLDQPNDCNADKLTTDYPMDNHSAT